MESEAIQVGDILEWCDNLGSPHRWLVKGIHLAGKHKDGRWGEGLIEMESTTHAPGWTGEWEYHPIVWVPEVLCRRLRKVPK